MADFTIPYGKKQLTFSLPDSLQTTLLAPKVVPAAADPLAAVAQALDQPVGGESLVDFTGIRSVAIAVNDKTRPVPHHHLLPPLLERVEALGVPPDAITLIIATGTHPVMTSDEYPNIIPQEIIDRYPIICHNSEDDESLTYLGETSRGIPLWLNRRYVEADLRLVVGNLEPHQFMGFSGGVKSAVIGLAGPETINRNHIMMMDPKSQLGQYDDNPARQDVEEMGKMAGIHFALNAILNDHKQIVTAIAGAPQAVMRHGIPLVKQLYQVEVTQPFDLMIVSPGGHPKDINVYQTQKGLAHAALVTKEGGTIILAAACPEGTGSKKYEHWVQSTSSFEAVFDRFKAEGFRVGPHKAFQIARDASRIKVLLISEMPDDFVRSLLLTPVKSLDVALAQALDTLSADARVGIMPLANATIPLLQNRR